MSGTIRLLGVAVAAALMATSPAAALQRAQSTAEATIGVQADSARSTDAPTPPDVQQNVRPIVDHHQHLESERAVRAYSLSPLAPIELPKPLTELLRKRAAAWKDLNALSLLFTRDSMALGIQRPGWVRGSSHSARAVGWINGPLWRPYELTPVAYSGNDRIVRIAGYYTSLPAPDFKLAGGARLGFFHIDAAREIDGEWRIVAEIPSFPSVREQEEPLDAAGLIRLLDEAGVEKAVILSSAYFFDGLPFISNEEYADVRAENDWLAQQVQQFPRRLVAFCSFNPTRDHAIDELERCAASGAFRGLKLHFGTSPVDLDNPAHVERTRRVFEAANRLRLPIQVHTAATPNWATADGGRRQAAVFLNELVSAAPDVPVVIAHLWGGAGFAESALAYFAEAVSSGDPAARNLYFEVSQAPLVTKGDPAKMQKVAGYMRKIGFERIYWGSDTARPPGISPEESWKQFTEKVPLSEEEFRFLATNVAPWAR